MPSVKGLQFDLELGEGLERFTPGRAGAMRILVLGDFSGRSHDERNQAEPHLDERPVVPVDVDNFEDVLARFAPRLNVPFPGGKVPVQLVFRSLYDFCPDSLCVRVPLIAQLCEIRGRLLDPSTFEAASADLRALLGGGLPDAKTETGVAEVLEEVPTETDAETIERLLGTPASADSQARSAQSERARAAVSDLIRHTLAPDAVTERPPYGDLYLRALDEAATEYLRALLHDPAFQDLEANWLSLHRLVTNLETDEGLQIHLLDVSKQELAADFAAAGGDLETSGLYRLLALGTGAGTPGGEPWTLLIGSFDFGLAAEDLGLLTSLGIIAARAGGPFLAAAKTELLGCSSLAETPGPSDWGELPADAEAAWDALRQTPIAPWVGLALPRVLLRLPYGKDTEPVDAFEFEEFGRARSHADYLWGNPAFLCALLIGQAYTARGWSMAPGDVLDVGDLPAHVYAEGGEKRVQACAEVYLSDRTAAAILDRGIMPLLSFRGRNVVRLARFQSIASPPAAIMGSWNG